MRRTPDTGECDKSVLGSIGGLGNLVDSTNDHEAHPAEGVAANDDRSSSDFVHGVDQYQDSDNAK